MAREKTKTFTAKIANTDLRARLDFISPDDDPPAMADLYWTLFIDHDDDSPTRTPRVKVDDVLTAQERTTLNGLLAQLRDAAFDAAGYTQT